MLTLLILDGYGIGKENKFNAIWKNSPNVEKLKKEYPFCTLNASGQFVGLSRGQMGNSETGHLNIGAGRVVFQNLTKIDNLIETDQLKENKVLLQSADHVKKTGGKVHLCGLLSNGGVHSHIQHLKYLLKFYNVEGCKCVLHCFLDGRDVLFNSGLKFLKEIVAFIKKNKINCELSSIVGRVYAMDREKRFDRVEKAYTLLTSNDEAKLKEFGIERAKNFETALKKHYANGNFDEYLTPIKLSNSVVESGDAVVSFNFRTDRMRELISAFGNKNFKEFNTQKFKNLFIATMTEYDKTFDFAHVIVEPEKIKNCLSEVLSKNGLKQFRVTETTKYAHITFFFNGEIETPFEGEERYLIDSINVQDFSVVPKMRAGEITKKAVETILAGKHDFMLINLSNPDMLGHTGNLKATKKAIRFVDKCVNKIYKASRKTNSTLIITADHGNAELMVDENGNKVTSHTTNKVPFVLISNKKNIKLSSGNLSDISPTILKLLKIKQPKEMTGKSLIKENV
ncbi:MAG: 2,3-bisphosphoglycerate-independent phosphoglycerate mutase [Clostridia bacterium]|nr:2,3-bisphosphoglycerate-independent phosphoglycerate mutase [Clostridia bacterium]